MSRFFSEHLDVNARTVEITDKKEIHHLKNVLRLKPGVCLTIFNGRGAEALGEITRFKKDTVIINIKKRRIANPSSKPGITLACAIPKKAKFETIIEKCTELGVDEIFPLITDRTEVRLDHEKCEHKAKRYHTVAVNAAKQSKRTTVTIVHPPLAFKKFLNTIEPDSMAFIPCLSGSRKRIQDVLNPRGDCEKIIFLIGPEGDFTAHEVDLAKEKGCIPVTLGPTTLKVDTAAIGVMAFINLYLERQDSINES